MGAWLDFQKLVFIDHLISEKGPGQARRTVVVDTAAASAGKAVHLWCRALRPEPQQVCAIAVQARIAMPAPAPVTGANTKKNAASPQAMKAR